MPSFFYFAYGSNMLEERLRKRCPSAIFCGIAYVCGYELRFNKRSKDCSGKANIVKIKNNKNKLYGVIFKINKNELSKLDKAEGNGYERKDDFIVVKVNNNQEIIVTTYFAKRGAINENLKPYHWYKQLILWGAIKAKLPNNYLAKLVAIKAERDYDEKRNEENLTKLKDVKNNSFPKKNPDMKIADQYTVADWEAMRTILAKGRNCEIKVSGRPDDWKQAFEIFFKKRIETRYFEPIRLLQEHGENKGEGFAIVALQCSLIEFLASIRTGQNYKHCQSGSDECEKYEYCQSSKLFTDFLRDEEPFKKAFSCKVKADSFYKHIRCSLLHEARTK